VSQWKEQPARDFLSYQASIEFVSVDETLVEGIVAWLAEVAPISGLRHASEQSLVPTRRNIEKVVAKAAARARADTERGLPSDTSIQFQSEAISGGFDLSVSPGGGSGITMFPITDGDWVHGLETSLVHVEPLVRALSTLPGLVYRMGYAARGEDDVLPDSSVPRAGAPPAFPAPFGDPPLTDVWWWMIFGPSWIARLGREHLLGTPSHQTTELRPDLILVQLWPTPEGCRTAEGRTIQARALAHLNAGVPLEDAMDRYAARERRRASVGVRWDSDLDQLLHLVANREINTTGLHAVGEVIDRWNTHPIHAVEERCSVSDAPPSTLASADAAATLRRIRVDLTEAAAINLEPALPAPFRGVPAELPLVDFMAWSHEWANTRIYDRVMEIEKVFIPSLGAHLGELLVSHLGGRWVPMSPLTDSYVILGDQGWFPFHRAAKALATRNGAVEHSLTKLWCEAARSVGQDPAIPRGWPEKEPND